MTKRTEAEWWEMFQVTANMCGEDKVQAVDIRVFAEAVRREALTEAESAIYKIYEWAEAQCENYGNKSGLSCMNTALDKSVEAIEALRTGDET